VSRVQHICGKQSKDTTGMFLGKSSMFRVLQEFVTLEFFLSLSWFTIQQQQQNTTKNDENKLQKMNKKNLKAA
jgi:hypothetical protein